MQVECCCIIAQHILRQRRHAHDASSFVDVFDSVLCPAQVRVGHCCPIAEVQLNVGPHGVALKPQEVISCTCLSHENILTEAEPAVVKKKKSGSLGDDVCLKAIFNNLTCMYVKRGA